LSKHKTKKLQISQRSDFFFLQAIHLHLNLTSISMFLI